MSDGFRIDDLRRRIQKDPASLAFAQLAEEYRRAGRWQDAIDACRAGLAIHPAYLSARVTLGRSLLAINQLDEAARELRMVAKKAPENLAAIRSLAEVFSRRGEAEEALAHYRAALALAPKDTMLEDTVNDLAGKLRPAIDPQPGRATRTIAALTKWLNAVHLHGSRTNSRA